MPNDRQWQRLTDEWVKASHESRKRKMASPERDAVPSKSERQREKLKHDGKQP